MTEFIEIVFLLLVVIGVLIYLLLRERRHSHEQQEHYFWMAAAAELYIFDYDAQRDSLRLSEACSYLLQLPTTIRKYSKVRDSFTTPAQRHGISYLERAMREDSKDLLFESKNAEGHDVYYRVSARRFCDHGDYKLNRVMGIFADVTADTLRERKLKLRAATDQLTGVYNRGAINGLVADALEEDRHEDKQDAFVMLDIDHFKEINDTHGHQVGDAAICELVTTIRRNIRSTDYVGRMGGDEFCLFLRDVPSAAFVEGFCDRIRAEVAASHTVLGPGAITISVGATLTTPYDDFTSLYSHADQALYRAKRAGRNSVVVIGTERHH